MRVLAIIACQCNDADPQYIYGHIYSIIATRAADQTYLQATSTLKKRAAIAVSHLFFPVAANGYDGQDERLHCGSVPPIMPAQIPCKRFHEKKKKKVALVTTHDQATDTDRVANTSGSSSDALRTSTPRLKSHPRRTPMGMPI